MTPLWREAIKPLLSARGAEEIERRDLLARARCFDLRGVQDLAVETSAELRRGAEFGAGEEWGRFDVDIGERACFPAPLMWMEFEGAGLLLESGLAINFQTVQDGPRRAIVPGVLGEVQIDDGQASVFRYHAPGAPVSDVDWKAEHGVQMLFLGLAGLAIINSPAAVGMSLPGHRGLARRLRQALGAAYREIKHTIVVIGKGRRSLGGEGVGGSPRAYHFCRAHARQRANGGIERVRAHWRGDPAFGIRLPTYKVCPDGPAVAPSK